EHHADVDSSSQESEAPKGGLTDSTSGPQTGGDSAQSDANGATAQPNAGKDSEQEGGSERQAKTEDDSSRSTSLAQSVAGAPQASARNVTAKGNASGNIVANSSDGSEAITTPFVRTTLLLLPLLMAAVACAAGQW
ncbi:hypothetical protein TraAM80_10316, partial [Trypanosoma rangeli]